MAVIRGYIEVAKIILPKVNLDKNGVTPLMHALENGHRDFAEMLFKAKKGDVPNVKAKDNIGRSPLHHAAIGGHVSAVEFLLGKQCPLEDIDKYGNTALLLAARFGRIAVMKSLINQGASKNVVNNRKKTILMLASESGVFAAVKLIVEPHLLDKVDIHGETALFSAVSKDHLEIFEFLVQIGASTKERNLKSETLLMKAVCGNSERVARYLMIKGSNITEVDKMGNTVLIHAINGKLLDMLQLLSEQPKWNEIVNHPNKKKDTPLMIAVRGGGIKVVQMLERKGALVNVSNKKQENPFMLACWHGYLDIAKFLVDACEKIENEENRIEVVKNFVCSSDIDGRTSLMAGAENLHCDVVRWLVNEVYPTLGVDMINEVNKEIKTALILASEYKKIDDKLIPTFDCLLNNGANINHEDEQKNTALINAIDNKNTNLVKFLVKKEATVNGKCFAKACRFKHFLVQKKFEKTMTGNELYNALITHKDSKGCLKTTLK